MYGTAFGIGNPSGYPQALSPFGLTSTMGQGIGIHPFGSQAQPYVQPLLNVPFGITSPPAIQTALQQIAQWLQFVPQQLQRLESLQQQQLLHVQQLLQLVPQQLQQLQQLIQVLQHQVQQSQQQSPALQPFGQSALSPFGVQPGSPVGWYGGQTVVQ